MSIFNGSTSLPGAIEQAGYRCIYVSCMWDEGSLEEARRGAAHAAIIDGIEKGVPAVVWGVHGCEWGLIVIVGVGRGQRLPENLPTFARYYAGHHYSARCYAREYLRELASRDRELHRAADAYTEDACCLRPVWERSPKVPRPDAELLNSLADFIRRARVAEEQGIERIGEFLAVRGA
ncbi:MAG TPA: hypothetical protein VLC48_03865 [Gemmatimonadota bacterium]|nr:hypothetical protein [Gemmatimonadota bacterium]